MSKNEQSYKGLNFSACSTETNFRDVLLELCPVAVNFHSNRKIGGQVI